MGRFKIYDPKKVVNILKDTRYAKCLICEKKLKNIMGNIKRHYQQMHNIVLNANTNIKQAKHKEDKLCMELRKRIEENKRTNAVIIKIDKKKNSYRLARQGNDTKSKLRIGATGTRSTHLHKNALSAIAKEEANSDSASKQNKATAVTKASTTEKAEKVISLIEGTIISRKYKLEVQNDKPEILALIKDKLPTLNNSNHKKIKLNIEKKETENINNEMEPQQQIICNSFIKNIQFSTLDSDHNDEFLKCFLETKTQLIIPSGNFQGGNTFQAALQSLEQNFELNYSFKTIGEHMDKMALKLRQEITKIVANKIIYLKLDIASKKQGNVMLINIQFIKDFEMKVFTLSALELLDVHLATYLKEKVLETLECYQIDIGRVHSMTKDNANNLRESLNQTKATLQDHADDETNVHSLTSEYCQHLSEQFPGHAVHFAACDIIKMLNENISQSRDSAQRLRRQMSQLNLKPLPQLDNSTSWFSIYDMITSLLNVRQKVESNSMLLVEVDWTFAVKFEASFRPIVDMASMLQSNNHFTMGDLYREWLLCELELEELSVCNELALYLLEALRKRKIDLFRNASFLAALYVDTRFCYIDTTHLNDKQKDLAISQLLKICSKLQLIQEHENNLTTSQKQPDRYIKLEQLIAANTQIGTTSSHHVESLHDVNEQWVKEALEQLQYEERLPLNTNILDYWKMAKFKYPLLAKIAEIALAAPATQATINRALNAWPIMIMGNNKNISKDNMESILLLKLNQDLVDHISL